MKKYIGLGLWVIAGALLADTFGVIDLKLPIKLG